MFTLLFLTAILFLQTIGSVAPDVIITYVVSALVTVGVTAGVKKLSGSNGLVATLIAYAISFVVAVAAFVVSTYLSGGEVTLQTVFNASTQIFTLAQIAYRAFPKFESGSSDDDAPSDGDAPAAAY